MSMLLNLVPTSNPIDQHHLRAVGLGFAIVGVGFTFAGIYRHPAWAWASAVIGAAATAIYWDGVGREENEEEE
jgi:hypothetical protein